MSNKITTLGLILTVVIGLLVGCGLGRDDSNSDDIEPKGEIKMSTGVQRTDSIEDDSILIKTEDEDRAVVDDTLVYDDEIEENGGPGDREGMFGNLPYTDNAVIEYYMGGSSDGEIYSFTNMYGLHVFEGRIVAIEDIIFMNLVNPETMTKAEKEQYVQDVYNQMEDANFERANGAEIIDAHNGYGNETAVSFVYYVFDPQTAPLENYELFISYFNEKGFFHINAGEN